MIANASAASPEKMIAIATPPPRHSTPVTSWVTLGRPCSIATSRSASAGRTRPARRAAARTASWAVTMPPPAAAASGIQERDGSKSSGATSRSASAATIAWASGRPAASPSTVATAETISASPAIRRRTWRDVAPSARSTAFSRRRWAIASANVPATTKSATKPAIPPMTPKIATSAARSPLGSPASASAAWSRSSTSKDGPRRAWSCFGVTPGAVNTPIARTWPGAPDNLAATAGAKNRAGSSERPATTPLTRYAASPPGATIRSVCPTRTPRRVSMTTSRESRGRPAGAQPERGQRRARPAVSFGGVPRTPVANAMSPIARSTPAVAADALHRRGVQQRRGHHRHGLVVAGPASPSGRRAPRRRRRRSDRVPARSARRPAATRWRRSARRRGRSRRRLRRASRDGCAGSARRSGASVSPRGASGARRPARRSARRAPRRAGRRP